MTEAKHTDNLRKVPRRHLIYYLRVYDIDTGDLLGNLVDISTRGIMLVSETPIAINTTFAMRMMLPETLEGSREVEFRGVSRWCRNDVNMHFYDTGFELIDPTIGFMEALDRLVDVCLFKE
jgi:hypothetical protein